ncbi:hypothetical protein I4U23_000957 [Adineta vaga]|nr:hypothetical protein I4U23_000957 [Adineta vaga]
MDLDIFRRHYGVFIVVSTFLSRIIFIGFCWSYGTVISQFKKQNTNLSDTELSWIGSIGQSFGGLFAPLILFLARRYGYQLTFILALLTCAISLLLSSYVQNLHWLLITYSLPYGFANAAIFILGTLLCGLYYPFNQQSKHIFVMCIISTGFPLGYHIMSAFVLSSIEKNGWQTMKRYMGLLELVAMFILGPFMTTKYLTNTISDYQPPLITKAETTNRRNYLSFPIVIWMIGIFTTMSGINNFLLHFVSFLLENKWFFFLLLMK